MSQSVQRLLKGTEILENIGLYKVCCGCDSIVVTQTAICPVCSSYNFEIEPELIEKEVKRICSPEFVKTTVLPDDML